MDLLKYLQNLLATSETSICASSFASCTPHLNGFRLYLDLIERIDVLDLSVDYIDKFCMLQILNCYFSLSQPDYMPNYACYLPTRAACS
jgi:hypothetical protein